MEGDEWEVDGRDGDRMKGGGWMHVMGDGMKGKGWMHVMVDGMKGGGWMHVKEVNDEWREKRAGVDKCDGGGGGRMPYQQRHQQ